jgi:hypothetical protein
MDVNTKIILRARGADVSVDVLLAPGWSVFPQAPQDLNNLGGELVSLMDLIFTTDYELEEGNIVLIFVFEGDDDPIKWRILLTCMREFIMEGLRRLYQ